MAHRTARLKIRGQWWRLLLRRIAPRRHGDHYLTMHGECKYSDREIIVNPQFDPERTTIHEVLHAALPDLDEITILEVETAVCDALTALRRLQPKNSSR
jgi:hypothetical protein